MVVTIIKLQLGYVLVWLYMFALVVGYDSRSAGRSYTNDRKSLTSTR